MYVYCDKEDLLPVLVFVGGKDNDGTVYDEVLQFKADTEEWSLAGHTIDARYRHAVSTMNFEDVRDVCFE